MLIDFSFQTNTANDAYDESKSVYKTRRNCQQVVVVVVIVVAIIDSMDVCGDASLVYCVCFHVSDLCRELVEFQ